jgi:hypothetical protein
MLDTLELKIAGDEQCGLELPVAEYIVDLEYYESLDALDALTASFHLPTKEEFDALTGHLVAGAPFELVMNDRTIEGDITRVSYSGGMGRPYSVSIFGLEFLHRLRNRLFSEIKEQTPDAVAKTLIGEASTDLSAKIQSVGATAEELVYLDDQMLTLLKRLADERNFALRCDGTDLHFAPRNSDSGSVTLDWNVDVYDAVIHTDISQVVNSVKVLGRDYVKEQDVDYKATELKDITGGTTAIDVRKSNLPDIDIQLNHMLSTGTSSEVEELATGELQRRAETFLSGTVVAFANCDVQVGQTLDFEKAPWPFIGPYLISGIVQSYTGGILKTTIEFFSDGVSDQE